jgi:hypothetical protein
MRSFSQSRRRAPQARPGAEALEKREVLTGGAGNTIALVPQAISQPGGTTTVDVKVDPTLFRFTKQGKLLLGIDVAPQSGSTATPKIKGVTLIDSGGGRTTTTKAQITRTTGSKAVLVPLQWRGTKAPGHTITVRTTIAGDKGTSGALLVGYYLPGDITGMGVVDKASIKAIKKQVGMTASNTNYQFDADANRDGKIDATDVSLAQQNLGTASAVSPVVTANLDPSAITNNQRVTSQDKVTFTGVATPGASIAYTELSGKAGTVATTADNTGSYTIQVPLGVGVNTFQVTTNDAFGQSISGQLTPVNRTTT